MVPLGQIAKSLGVMLVAPIRVRRHPPQPPSAADHYEIPILALTLGSTVTKAVDLPVVCTPPGRWKEWPPLVLAGCDEPLAEDVPDLRGVWQVYKGPLKGHIERNEQAGARVVITGGGVIHDLTADGSLMSDEGVGGARISVTARYEDDGSVKILIAHSDPGSAHKNWLNTLGHSEGGMLGRIIGADGGWPSEWKTEVVKFDSVKG